jgi:galactose mutarotase-like enzyme
VGASARLGVLDGVGILTLAAGPLEVVVAPERAMAGVSVRFEGRPYVGATPVLPSVAAGPTGGVPLLHPWANRLSADRFVVPGTDRSIDLEGVAGLRRDAHGLALHGTAVAVDGWDLTWLEVDEEGDGVVAEGVLAFDRRPELLAGFPFPHRVHVRWEVLDAGHPDGTDRPLARVTTAVVPMGDAEVPVAFGWHPYLALPGIDRSRWRLVLPERERLDLDDRGLPTGDEDYEPAEAEPLGARTFDDCYRLGTDRTVGLAAEDRWVALSFDEGFPYVQVYAPADDDVVALEPMTAPVDALVRGTTAWAVGAPATASFTIDCG